MNPFPEVIGGDVQVIVVQPVLDHPDVEATLHRTIEARAERVKYLVCEGPWVFDPYGSLMRTLLSITHRHPSVREIWVVGYPDGADGGIETFRMGDLECTPARQETLSYMLQHVIQVEPSRWMMHGATSARDLGETVRVIQTHPILPSRVNVKGYVFDGSELALVAPDAKSMDTPRQPI